MKIKKGKQKNYLPKTLKMGFMYVNLANLYQEKKKKTFADGVILLMS